MCARRMGRGEGGGRCWAGAMEWDGNIGNWKKNNLVRSMIRR
jgi:hypothetical protein